MKKQKSKKFVRKLFKFTSIMFVLFIAGFIINFFATTYNTKLSSDDLTKAYSTPSFLLLDSDKNKIESASTNSSAVEFDSIPNHTINAFLTSEDRNFYSHHGIDYKRVIGAIYNNIKTRSLSQGGSTISQQLIKNTHLSSEKTIDRKLKEFKLTKELEKKYSKNKILELYLNTIYFGNGCYGISEACNFYFNKDVKNISLAESAMLAGIISSPSYNEPIKYYEKANKRKNIILSNMKKLGKITNEEYESAVSENITVAKHNSKKSVTSQYTKSVISEAAKILKLTENQIRNKNLIIETNLNNTLNQELETLVNNSSFTPENDNNILPVVQCIVIDNNSRNVIAYANNSKTNLENLKRQPGSVIKPILVYAPAFESGKIVPSSFILDEQTSFGEYTPKNHNNKYNGWTTIRESISKSLNIPAVKTLSYVGLDNAKTFAKKIGINFTKEDNHLALALGGFSEGETIKSIADAYSAFACKGNYCESKFITKISDINKRTLYERNLNQTSCMKEETAYMVTDTLKSAVKNGTAKKLNFDNFEIASKTGTTNNNLDAWNACYTTNHTIVTWIGNLNNEKLNSSINGSTYPTLISREVAKILYKDNTPQNFQVPDGIIKANLDEEKSKQNMLELDKDQTINKEKEEIFTKDNLPKINKNENIIIKATIINEFNNNPKIKIYSKNAENLTIYKEINNKSAVFKEFFSPDENIEIEDKDANSGELITYKIQAKTGSQTTTTKDLKIKCF